MAGARSVIFVHESVAAWRIEAIKAAGGEVRVVAGHYDAAVEAADAAAAAEVKHPVEQGLVQAFSVYVDTLFVCSATALMILFTGQYNVVNPEGGFIVENLPGIKEGAAFTQAAVGVHFPSIGGGFVAVSLLFFAFTTIMAYYYIAETNLSYLDRKGNNRLLVWGLRILILVTTFYGSIKTAAVAWTMGDIGVGMMAWLNIIAILLLQRPALKALRDYQQQKKSRQTARIPA